MDHNIETARSNNFPLAFYPLVLATAERFRKYGAACGVAYEDVEQECWTAALEIMAECENSRWLPVILKRKLPYYVSRAIKRQQCQMCETGLEGLEELIPEQETRRRIKEMELEDILRRSLSDEELNIVQALQTGYTQQDVAEMLGVSQSAVAQRLRRIKKKIRGIMGQ